MRREELDAVRSSAPPGFVYVHVAWFNDRSGDWIGEWTGFLPEPEIPPTARGDERNALLDEWLHSMTCYMSPDVNPFPTVESAWNVAEWDACPSGGAVCLDVEKFEWPIGSHVWHRWDRVARRLDWGREHAFIRIDPSTRLVVGTNRTHNPPLPTRDIMIDVTDTPLEAIAERTIGGRLMQRGAIWTLEFGADETLALPVAATLDDALMTMKEKVLA